VTHDLVGRGVERARLEAALAGAVAGSGSLVLVSGDAGVGKTRLTEDVFSGAADVSVVRGAASVGCSPVGPLTTAIRGYLRQEPNGLDACGPLRRHLALLLPELGPARRSDDRATLFEALRCGLITIIAKRPAAILLDDLQWSDEATLEFLAELAPALGEMPLLVVAAYRSDELPRTHPVRRLRHDLRRERVRREVHLEPLRPAETAALAE
jgi:predicted ATPase